MYGIPHDIDWNFLLGAKVEQIAIGEYNIQIRFFKDVSISTQGAFDHLVDGKLLSDAPELPKRAITLISLLGSKVENVTVENDRTLAVTFSNREAVKIYDSFERYESFTVNYPGGPVIVV